MATPKHYAYVKIAEGCDYKCAFCIIPTLRGEYRSRPGDSIVREARALAARGVKELLLISQDTTFYGIDRQRARRARPAAARAERDRRPRVDPAALPLSDHDRRRDAGGDGGVRQGLQLHRPAAAARVERGAQADEAARHARRPTTRCSTRIRERVPGVALRTTFIVGFPGETEADVDELCALRRRSRVRPCRRLHLLARGRHLGLSSSTTMCRRGRRRRGGARVMGLQKKLVRKRQQRARSASGSGS